MTAGIHGYEYPPILALQRLQVKKLAGTLIIVHVANMPSFLGRTVYFSPLDGKNLNRVFPGRKDGTESEQIAHAITTNVIDKCDYLLDLHCGDGNESLRPYVYQTVTGDPAFDERIAELVANCGFDHIVIDRARPKDPAASMYCSNTAITRGKPAMTVESGFLGSTDEKSTLAILRGVESVMRYLKMIDGKPVKIKPVYLDPAEVLTSPATGILYPHVERNAMVKKGAVLAHITDFFGKKDRGREGSARGRGALCGRYAADYEGAAGGLRGSYSTLTKNNPRAGAVGPEGLHCLGASPDFRYFPSPLRAKLLRCCGPCALRIRCL